MTTIKRQTAEALFPLLSAFHDVNGLTLKAVSSGSSEETTRQHYLRFWAEMSSRQSRRRR